MTTLSKIESIAETLSQIKREIKEKYLKTLMDKNLIFNSNITYQGKVYTIITFELFLKVNNCNNLGDYIENPYKLNRYLNDLMCGKIAVIDEEGNCDVIDY